MVFKHVKVALSAQKQWIETNHIDRTGSDQEQYSRTKQKTVICEDGHSLVPFIKCPATEMGTLHTKT